MSVSRTKTLGPLCDTFNRNESKREGPPCATPQFILLVFCPFFLFSTVFSCSSRDCSFSSWRAASIASPSLLLVLRFGRSDRRSLYLPTNLLCCVSVSSASQHHGSREPGPAGEVRKVGQEESYWVGRTQFCAIMGQLSSVRRCVVSRDNSS